MVNYSKSMIYKLCCKDPNITSIYIGSTTNFYRRKSEHKTSCNNENNKRYNTNVYKFIRDNSGFENFDMILIENVSCNNKRELFKIERKYIDELKPSLNITKPYVTEEEKIKYKKEYNEENKEWLCKKKVKEYRKQYYEKNKNQILEKQKEKINCEFCNCLTSKSTIRRHQQSVKCQKFQFIED